MHSPNFNYDPNSGSKSEAEILLSVTSLITEGRIPEKLGPKSRGFREGPHCYLSYQSNEHICNLTDSLCVNYEYTREELLKLWMQEIPICIEVILTCPCHEGEYFVGPNIVENFILLESWNFNLTNKRVLTLPSFQVPQLVNAIRSQLYFSQITAWLTTQEENSKIRLTNKHLRYRIVLPGETFKTAKFMTNSVEHNFPSTDIGYNRVLNVSFLSLPRRSSFPIIKCLSCKPVEEIVKTVVSRASHDDNNQEDKPGGENNKKVMVDDRMHPLCKLKGKHHCEDFEEIENVNKSEKLAKFKRFRQNLCEEPSTSTLNHINNTRKCHTKQSEAELIDTMLSNDSVHHKTNDDVGKNIDETFYNYLIYREEDKSKILLEAIERVGLKSPEKMRIKSDEGIPQNSRHKIKDIETEIGENYSHDKNETSVVDMQCEYDLVNTNYNCPKDILQYTNSSHETEKTLSFLNNRHKSADLELRPDEKMGCASNKCVCDNLHCDKRKSDTNSYKNRLSVYIDRKYCDSPFPTQLIECEDISNNFDKKKLVTRKLNFENLKNAKLEALSSQHLTEKYCFNNLNGVIPTAVEQAEFRKNLDNAASMVFHSRTGLPLTSSPAPVRKGKTCFDFDSSINSVSAIKSALFSSSFSTDDDSESDGSLVSPCSPDIYLTHQDKVEGESEPKSPVRWQRRRKGHASSLLGSFEESVLNGRLEPVSTVHGFTAELGASGSFVPKHLVVPVTVFFYTLGDIDKVSSPYLCHINLGKKGYCVPKRGTVQVTLFNPLGTVVKMFVIMYDLIDMPPSSQTFIRQRTLYMPNNCKDSNIEWGPKWLKYLIHLRFVSSKSGKIYLHSDIRMIIFHKSDLDTASAHGMDLCYELRSFTLMPVNPRFSPRK